MPVRLDQRVWFPDPAQADADGLVAVGGDFSPERLLAAYAAAKRRLLEDAAALLRRRAAAAVGFHPSPPDGPQSRDNLGCSSTALPQAAFPPSAARPSRPRQSRPGLLGSGSPRPGQLRCLVPECASAVTRSGDRIVGRHWHRVAR